MKHFDYVCLRIYFGLRSLSVLAFNKLDAMIDRRNEIKRKGRGA
nr:MAG TPA: hypothetical protein [Caudoviricetes sp.]